MPALKPEHLPILDRACTDLAASLSPAQPSDIVAVLIRLRSSTLDLDCDEREKEATFRILCRELANTPLDILNRAVKAYINKPGKRFFPKAPGELREFIDPLLNTRKSYAYRFSLMRAEAKAVAEREEKLKNDPLTPDDIADIKREFGIDRLGCEIGKMFGERV